MEEEKKTLQELNNEFKNLTIEVNALQSILKKLEEQKKVLKEKSNRQSMEYVEAKELYDRLSATDTNHFSVALKNKFMQELQKAEVNMNAKKALWDKTEEELNNNYNEYDRTKQRAEIVNARMELILVSFSFNEVIHNALENEIINDYGKLTDKKQTEIARLEALKDAISQDTSITSELEQLRNLKNEYESAYSKLIAGGDTTEFNKLNNKIAEQRRLIRAMIRRHGLDDGDISNDEIDGMIDSRDSIPEIDRQIKAIEDEIGTLLAEKNNIINSMSIGLQMAKNPTDSSEYKELETEISDLETEISSLQTSKKEISDSLEDNEKTIGSLEEELKKLQGENPNSEKIQELQTELDAINAEEIALVDNPEIAQITAQIQKLEARKETGAPGSVETEEYINAREALKKARENLEKEKNEPSVNPNDPGYSELDQIVDNPDVINLKQDIESYKNKLEEIYSDLSSKNQDFKNAKDDYFNAIQATKEAKNDFDTKNQEQEEYISKLKEDYIIPEFYEGINDENSDVGKAFKDYEKKQLIVREKMSHFLENPSSENIDALKQAISDFKNSKNEFSDQLFAVGQVRPNDNAMYNLLMGTIAECYKEDPTLVSDEYNSLKFYNKLKTAKSSNKKADIEQVENESNSLIDKIEEIFKGEVEDDQLESLYTSYETAFSGLDDKVKNSITSNNLPAKTEGILSKVKNKIKQLWNGGTTETFPFTGISLGLSGKDEYCYNYYYPNICEVAKNAYDVAKQIEENKLETFNIVRNAVASDEQKSIISELERKINEANDKIQCLPPKINETILARKKADVEEAKRNLDSTLQYESTTNNQEINETIANLKNEISKLPKQIEDPEKVADRNQRAKDKQDEITQLNNSNGNEEREERINKELSELKANNSKLNSQLEKADEEIKSKQEKLQTKRQSMSILKAAKQKIAKLIKIINPRDMSDVRNGDPARELADAAKERYGWRSDNDSHDERC